MVAPAAARAASATISQIRSRGLTQPSLAGSTGAAGALILRTRACKFLQLVATLFEPMPNYRELLNQVKGEIEEIDAGGAARLLESDDPPALVDVREQDEWDGGIIPGAIHIPRGFLESRAEQALPDRERPVIVYCAGGSRSAFAAKSLEELGYENVVSLAGGY